MDSEKVIEGCSVLTRMRALILPTFAFVAGLVLMIAAPALANAPVAAAEGCTIPGKGSLLRVRQEFELGDKAPRQITPQMKERLSREIEEYEDRTERAFNEGGYKNTDGTRILLDIDAKSFYDSSSGSGGTPGYNKVMLYGNESHQDRVSGIGVINDPSNTTDAYWRRSTVTNPQNSDVALHEIGHQLGLREGYREYITDRSGRRQVERPDGMETNIDNEVIEPQRWRQWARRNGLDPNSLRSDAVNKPGHEGDIMGVTGNGNARFRARDLRRLLRGSPKCRDEDNELIDKADQQPDFDTRGPRIPNRNCYYRLINFYDSRTGNKFSEEFEGVIPFWPIPYRSFPDSDSVLLRYKPFEPGEKWPIKIACKWRTETNYLKQLLKFYKEVRENERNVATNVINKAPCSEILPFFSIKYPWLRMEQAISNVNAISKEIAARHVTVTAAFLQFRITGHQVKGYPRRAFRQYQKYMHSKFEKLNNQNQKTLSSSYFNKGDQCADAATGN